jgi:hypothetical protein
MLRLWVRIVVVGIALLVTAWPYWTLALVVSGYHLVQWMAAWALVLWPYLVASFLRGVDARWIGNDREPIASAVLGALFLSFPFGLFFYERSDGSLALVTTDRLAEHLTFPTTYLWALIYFGAFIAARGVLPRPRLGERASF